MTDDNLEYRSAYDMPQFDVDEFIEGCNSMPKQDEIIEGILPKGQVMLLTGDPFEGKSLEVQYLAIAFGFGSEYHGLKVKKCRALYLTWEGSGQGLAARFKKILNGATPDIKPRIKMLPEPTPFNTAAGYNMIADILNRTKQEQDIEVVLYDSYPYTITGKLHKDEVVNEWWSIMTKIHYDLQLTPIFIFEQRKLIWGRDPEERFSLDRLKGAKTLAYKANTVIAIGKNMVKKWNPEIQKTQHTQDGSLIVALKVKDAVGLFKPLHVDLNRDTCLFNGQKWKFDENTSVYDNVACE